ncbi:MAG: Maf family nucleotide pyrophosphatase [Gammaproteobacteria bacterium]|jgi:septum formation protein
MSKNTMTLVLASSSKPRKSLMNRLQAPYVSFSPDIDESPKDNETTKDLVLRLALEKAQAVATQFPNALIIGCDQTAECEGVQLNKPHHFDKAVEQLTSVSGKKVQFITGLCVLNTSTGHMQLHNEITDTYFKQLTQSQIENYLHKEQPYECCGSIKSEGLGIALVDKIVSNDPTSLIGMPMIALVRMLEHEGFTII